MERKAERKRKKRFDGKGEYNRSCSQLENTGETKAEHLENGTFYEQWRGEKPRQSARKNEERQKICPNQVETYRDDSQKNSKEK